ncbi:dATP pyrophosphohydrolase [Phenylobacterium sp.]|uniref:dATP pyrophosphohydrolase n=1 Tax=Phenylobacterium sp. TaxID=1871053 RepID=UPI00286A3303|nr:dATP pyrophosphohydrolase [Phenylobacterium sp.]
MTLTIQPVVTKADLDRFIRVPMTLAAGDPNWIAPLVSERAAALTPKTNPFFQHAEVQLWIAVRDGRDVGRISAQIDALAPVDPARPAGHFGMIAGEDDPDVFAALLATAEAWLKARGCAVALGPFNLSVNEEVGLLVDGFDTPPMVLMGHDPAHAGRHIEAAGYAKAKDVYAYLCQMSDDIPPAILRRVRRGPAPGVTLRMLDMSRYDAEVAAMTEVLNDAWSGNWGFTPTTEAETAQLGKALRAVIDPRLIWFAEFDGEVAGFVVMLPNVNEAIADLNGALFPFGWAKLLWRLKVARVKSIRIPLMGVKRKFASSHRGQLLPFQLMDLSATQARALGYQSYELSWILEDNAPMNRICQSLGGRIYKTYRIYEKALA